MRRRSETAFVACIDCFNKSTVHTTKLPNEFRTAYKDKRKKKKKIQC
jgi:hypothetical protein